MTYDAKTRKVIAETCDLCYRLIPETLVFLEQKGVDVSQTYVTRVWEEDGGLRQMILADPILVSDPKKIYLF